jgi:hypothetical protein
MEDGRSGRGWLFPFVLVIFVGDFPPLTVGGRVEDSIDVERKTSRALHLPRRSGLVVLEEVSATPAFESCHQILLAR